MEWRDSWHFDASSPAPAPCCDKPKALRSHYREPAHRARAESWIAANPTDERLDQFASDVQPKRQRDVEHA
ncbi:hypothetical protein ACF1G0_33010 [Streptomyces sp. NPDC013953]|uniref:hypothetical protein n=1 Tax=Streptomyces sp. NPDC013953 TaxID=3364868 RepID=UPI0036F6A571